MNLALCTSRPRIRMSCSVRPKNSRPAAIVVGSLLLTIVFGSQLSHSATLDPSGVDEASFVSAPADTRALASKVADLEKVFWICDYTATMHGIDRDLAVACSGVTDELKQMKFGGSYEKLLAWWRLDKLARHQGLQQASTAQFAQ